MASLVLGAAGAFVGNLILPGIGGTIGWAIGSAVGGALFGPSREGPRITDKRLQTSSFGSTIPIIYGTDRVAGNVIFQTDLQEHKNVSGGKGGPKVTTYTYTATFAIALCEGPIIGVRKIWADSRLIRGENMSGPQTLPITIYLGDETQLPDPAMESILGVGNVPAHRGLAYIVFNDLPLAGYGNRLPLFTFEIMATGDFSITRFNFFDSDQNGLLTITGSPPEPTPNFPAVMLGYQLSGDTLTAWTYWAPADYGAPHDDNDLLYFRESTYSNSAVLPSPIPDWLTSVDGSFSMSFALSSFVGVPVSMYIWGIQTSFNSGVCFANGTCYADITSPGSHDFCVFAAWVIDDVMTYGEVGPTSSATLRKMSSAVTGNGYIYAVQSFGTIPPCTVERFPFINGVPTSFASDASFTFDGITGAEDIRAATSCDVTVDASTGHVWVRGADAGTISGPQYHIFELTSDLTLINHWDLSALGSKPWYAPVMDGAGIQGQFVVYLGYVINGSALGTNSAPGGVTYNNDSYVMWHVYPPAGADWIPVAYFPTTAWSPLSYLGENYAIGKDGVIQINAGTTLAAIVTAISEKAGLTTSDIDVSELPDPVDGYKITNQILCRAAIEPLMPGYFFDAVESDTKVKFPKRKGTPLLTIPDDDLGAHEGGAAPVPLIAGQRLQEFDLPALVNVNYINLDADYQDGSQFERRQATTSELAVTVQVPVVMRDTKAKSIVTTLMYNSWLEREKYQIAVPRKYAYLDPTDVVAAQGHTLRLVNESYSQKNIVQFDAVRTRADVWLQAPQPAPATTYIPGGGSGGFVPQNPPTLAHTDLQLLDIPLVADGDFPNGYYYAVAGLSPTGWPGAVLFKSDDGGVNFAEIADTSNPSSIGRALSVLGDFAGGNTFDELNSVNVVIDSGSPALDSSNTLGVLNGANTAMLGAEMIQFRTATLVSGSVYTLSGLLRGRRGTDWAMGSHATGDIFVLLPANNVNGPFAELASTRVYRGITLGAPLSSEGNISFSNDGTALRPYAPVALGGGRNAAGDIILNWTRRTRIGGAWLDFVDVPLSETVESYQVLFYSDGTYTSQVYAVNPLVQTYTFTAADQTTVYGSPQATLYWGVLQYGSFEPGYEARAVT